MEWVGAGLIGAVAWWVGYYQGWNASHRYCRACLVDLRTGQEG